MADKTVQINFNVNAGDATQKLTQISTGLENVTQKTQKTGGAFGNTNNTLLSFNRIIQDAPFGIMGVSNNITFLAEQMVYAKQHGAGYIAQIKSMGAAMMGTGGLMFAISAVTSLVTFFSMQTRGAAKQLGEFTLESVTATESTKAWSDSLKKITKELSEMTNGEVISAMGLMVKNLNDLDLAAGKLLGRMTFVESKYGILGELFFGSDLDDTIKKIIEAQAALNVAEGLGKTGSGRIPQLRGEIKRLEEARDSIPKGVSDSVFESYNSGIRKLQKELDGLLGKELSNRKKIKQEVVELNDILKERLALEIKFAEQFGQSLLPHEQSAGLGSGMTMRKLPNRDLGFLGISDQEMKKQFAEFNVIANAAAQTMRQAFSQAWQDIFGEANSLLEIFLQNIASGLLSLAAGSVATTIFSFLTGGLGGALGAFKPSGGDNIINLKIGDETVERFVYKGLPGAMNYATRIRAF